jgi:hypothetical protein
MSWRRRLRSCPTVKFGDDQHVILFELVQQSHKGGALLDGGGTGHRFRDDAARTHRKPGRLDLLDLVLGGLPDSGDADIGEGARHRRGFPVHKRCPLIPSRPQSVKLYYGRVCKGCPYTFVFGQVSATSRAQLGATLDNVDNTQYRRYEARWHRCTNTGLPRTSWSVHGCDSSTIFQPSVLVLA